MSEQATMTPSLLSLTNVGKHFGVTAHDRIDILQDVNFNAVAGQQYAIVGPSGSGKSTLLYLMGLLDKPSVGKVLYAGQDVTQLSDNQRSKLRNDAFGFVYQFHYLMSEFTALENVMMPGLIRGDDSAMLEARGMELLEQVGVAARAGHYPSMLSGGEQQRVALARGLMNRPQILLADEPTGNLDPHSAELVFELLQQISRDENMTLILVTHNHDLARRCDRRYQMDEGRLIEQ